MFIALSKIRAMENLPSAVLQSVIDSTYAEDVISGMNLEASYKSLSFAKERGEWVGVPVSTGDTVMACIVGKFVKVEF